MSADTTDPEFREMLAKLVGIPDAEVVSVRPVKFVVELRHGTSPITTEFRTVVIE